MSLGAVAVAATGRRRWREREGEARAALSLAQCSSWECLSLSSIPDEAASVGGWRWLHGRRRDGREGEEQEEEELVAKGEFPERYYDISSCVRVQSMVLKFIASQIRCAKPNCGLSSRISLHCDDSNKLQPPQHRIIRQVS